MAWVTAVVHVQSIAQDLPHAMDMARKKKDNNYNKHILSRAIEARFTFSQVKLDTSDGETWEIFVE